MRGFERNETFVTNEMGTYERSVAVSRAIKDGSIEINDGYTFLGVGSISRILSEILTIYDEVGILPSKIDIVDISESRINRNATLLSTPQSILNEISSTSLLKYVYADIEIRSRVGDRFLISIDGNIVEINLSLKSITEVKGNYDMCDISNVARWCDLSGLNRDSALRNTGLILASDFINGWNVLHSSIISYERVSTFRCLSSSYLPDDDVCDDPRIEKKSNGYLHACATTSFSLIIGGEQ